MGWVERLWRNDGRVKATPSRVATLLADSVTRSTNLLRVRLDAELHSRDDRKRFEKPERHAPGNGAHRICQPTQNRGSESL